MNEIETSTRTDARADQGSPETTRKTARQAQRQLLAIPSSAGRSRWTFDEDGAGEDRPSAATLRFTPTAWQKLLTLRDVGGTEVGGFGICGTGDLLLVTDIAVVAQRATVASVTLEDEGVADHFDRFADAGLAPGQFARWWIHTHPGQSPTPSDTDEACFDRVFGECDWAGMFILARGGRSYARLRFTAGPGGQVEIPSAVDFFAGVEPAQRATWEREARENVRSATALAGPSRGIRRRMEPAATDECLAEEWLAELEAMDADERRAVLDELRCGRPDLLDEAIVTPYDPWADDDKNDENDENEEEDEWPIQ